eukprot:scaffold59291_cov74-Cyclotella_meneghiniana.AAC.3
MSTRVITLTSTPQNNARVRRRSDVNHHHLEPSTNNDSFNTADGRSGLFDFLHNGLRISTETSEAYCNALTENGYDDVSSLQDATEMDLKEMGVKIGHVRRIKRAVFSNCMRKERLSAGRIRRASDVSLLANATIDEGSAVETVAGASHPIEGALLSDFARREFLSSRESIDAIDSKEALIRKQAEKIASLEAKLAHIDVNEDTKSSSSRGGSAETHYSRRLTAEERLQIHKERKMQEEKYKEQSGKWDAPAPKKKEKSITSKVRENDDLVLKLTSDASFRRKIDEEEKTSKKSARKSLSRDRSPTSRTLHPTRKLLNRQNNRGDFDASPSGSEREFRRHRSPVKISCDTCGSRRDCEEDIDNPGIYYCKPCWEEYENEIHEVKSPYGNVSMPLHENHQGVVTNSEVHHALWIAHDNPQLGEKIIYPRPRRMECMLETKEPGKKDCVRVIIGDIDYSGRIQNAGIGNLQGTETEQGTECIRIRNAKGYYVDHNQVATRLSRDKTVYEFQLGDENAHYLTGKNASKSIEEFFKDCHGAIDVILDPQRDAGGWYPQKEARSGGRKIAPQFRSKGVGYIRLGDDMSEHGSAFLSVNACSTFLSSGNPKIVTPTTSKTSSSTLKPTPKVTVQKTRSNRSIRPPVESSADDSDDESAEDEGPNTVEVLKQLQSAGTDSNMKWKDKADLISQLGKGTSRQEWSHLRPQALNVLQDTLGGKNTNVHVVRSALIAAGMIGISMGGELVLQNSWKTIMIETMKLLKSKQCGSVAKTVLAQLHGRCFTLANSLEMVTHVLGLGNVATASKSKRSRPSVTETPKPRRVSAITPNNIEVIEWLAEITERERNLEVIDPILDTSNLNVLVDLFLTHADHRDQRCRKSASDGLMHSILYGVTSMGMELTRVVRMLSGLKEANLRMWKQIVKSAQTVLEAEK